MPRGFVLSTVLVSDDDRCPLVAKRGEFASDWSWMAASAVCVGGRSERIGVRWLSKCGLRNAALSCCRRSGLSFVAISALRSRSWASRAWASCSSLRRRVWTLCAMPMSRVWSNGWTLRGCSDLVTCLLGWTRGSCAAQLEGRGFFAMRVISRPPPESIKNIAGCSPCSPSRTVSVKWCPRDGARPSEPPVPSRKTGVPSRSAGVGGVLCLASCEYRLVCLLLRGTGLCEPIDPLLLLCFASE